VTGYYTSTQMVAPGGGANGTYSVATDGVTSDGGRLQQIIDAAAPNTRIILPDGVIRPAKPLIMRHRKQLVGAGPHRTHIVQPAPDQSCFTVENWAEDWHLEGFAIHGTKRPGVTMRPVAGLSTYGGHRGTIRDVKIANTEGIGLQIGGTQNMVIEDVHIQYVGFHGLWLGWHTANKSMNFAAGAKVRRLNMHNIDVDGIEVHRDADFEDVMLVDVATNYVAPDGFGTAGGFYVMEVGYHASPDFEPAVNVRARNVRVYRSVGAGFDIGNGATDILLQDCKAIANGGAGFSIAGKDCTVQRFQAYGNGGGSRTVLKAGVVIGGQMGSRGCHRNLISEGICEYNVDYGIDIVDRTTFPSYGDTPIWNRILDVHMQGNKAIIRNPNPHAPNTIRLINA
jgi:hypothetical protein